MSLTDAYVQIYGQLDQFFQEIRRGQAPRQFSIQHLKDLGFSSSNYRALIPLLKALGFLSADGQPTQRYHDYRDATQSGRVMAEALREAYADLFVLRSNPTEADRSLIEGKFKSTHNVSDRLAKLMASTFFSLLGLADFSATGPRQEPPKELEPPSKLIEPPPALATKPSIANLHYNIQIHLPATKDIEVFNAIFKSLREHLID